MKKSIFAIILSLLFARPSTASTPPDPNYPLGAAKILQSSLYHVQSDHYNSSRMDSKDLFLGALEAIQQTVPEILVQCPGKTFCTVTVYQAAKRFSIPQQMEELLSELKTVLLFIQMNAHVETDKREIEFAVVRGMLDRLDPHSNFLPPEVLREFQVSTDGQFGGLGIVIGLKEGKLSVISPLSGTPASRAGVKSGDHILQIDDESTVNMELTEAVNLLRGRVGTTVALKIERKGTESFSLSLKRAIINIDAVQSALLKTPGRKNVAMIRVKSFQANTYRDFLKSYAKLQKDTKGTLAGLVLDLRNNPGGLLEQAIVLSDFFLQSGMIVATVGPNRTVLDQSNADEKGLDPSLPVVVLTNQGSASASEIVAGALKYNDRAIVLGGQTFGKGSVQTIYKLPEDSGLKLTIAEYWTSGDRSIQSIGITPDIYLVPVVIDKKNLDYVENQYRLEKDLEKHLEKTSSTEDKPSFKLQYLAPTREEEEEMEYSETIDIQKDVVAQLSLSLFDSEQQNHRLAWLEQLKPVLQQQQKRQEEKISKAFQALNVTWNDLPKTAPMPQAQVKFQLIQKETIVSQLKAGTEAVLKLTLKNIGKGPYVKLLGSTDSSNSIFKDLEFAFGTLQPEQSATWEVPVKIPASTPAQETKISVRFQEEHGHIPANIDLFVPIQAEPKPHLSYEYKLEGAGESTLPRKKTLHLKVNVYNESPNPSHETIVLLKNLGGKELFIEKGRTSLKSIPAGGKGEVDFAFHIDPKFEGKTIPLELSIFDNELMGGILRELELQMTSKKHFLNPPEGHRYNPPAIHITTKILQKTDKPNLLIQGTAEDDEQVKDIYAFLGEKKVLYQANPEKKKSLPFSTPLLLEKGSNTVIVTARDNWNLQNSEIWMIYYQ